MLYRDSPEFTQHQQVLAEWTQWYYHNNHSSLMFYGVRGSVNAKFNNLKDLIGGVLKKETGHLRKMMEALKPIPLGFDRLLLMIMSADTQLRDCTALVEFREAIGTSLISISGACPMDKPLLDLVGLVSSKLLGIEVLCGRGVYGKVVSLVSDVINSHPTAAREANTQIVFPRRKLAVFLWERLGGSIFNRDYQDAKTTVLRQEKGLQFKHSTEQVHAILLGQAARSAKKLPIWVEKRANCAESVSTLMMHFKPVLLDQYRSCLTNWTNLTKEGPAPISDKVIDAACEKLVKAYVAMCKDGATEQDVVGIPELSLPETKYLVLDLEGYSEDQKQPPKLDAFGEWVTAKPHINQLINQDFAELEQRVISAGIAYDSAVVYGTNTGRKAAAVQGLSAPYGTAEEKAEAITAEFGGIMKEHYAKERQELARHIQKVYGTSEEMTAAAVCAFKGTASAPKSGKQPTNQGNNMSLTPTTNNSGETPAFTKISYVFGRAIKDCSEEFLLGSIRKVEQEIAELSAIKVESKKIAKRIQEANANLAKIVKVLDKQK